MRYALAALAFLVSPAFAAERLPTFPKNTEYAEARPRLIALGWQPIKMPDALECYDERCTGRPELHACADTGLGRCFFTWRRNDTLISIRTVGETPVVVEHVKCLAGC